MTDKQSPTTVKANRTGPWADVIVGLTKGVANIPDAMANALLAGISPFVGLYALLAGTPVAALTTSSHFMTVAVTSAMAVTVGSGLASVPVPQRDEAATVVALLVGVFMFLLGILRGGRLLRFVSNAVMKGFLNGVAILVIVGQLSNITRFESSKATKLGQAVDTVVHASDWHLTTLLVGLLTVAIILVLTRTRLKNFAMLVALVVATAAVYLLQTDVALVKDISPIPSGLPMPSLPDLTLVPQLIVPALSVSLIALVQGGGISKAFPNADGTYPDASRDMIGQGFGNLASGAFGGMPVGASVSSTAMGVAGGARTRWSNVMVGVVIAIVLLLLGPLVELVPLSVLAGILIMVGIMAIDFHGMQDVWNASKESAAIMGITLGSMLVMPVQYAVLLGAALSAMQYVYSSSKDVRVVELRQLPGGQWAERTPPAVLPDNAVTVIDIYGSVFYAGVELIDKLLPSVGDAERPVLVVRMRSRAEMGSTFIVMLRRYHQEVIAAGGRVILVGVSDRLRAQLESIGLLQELGAENVLSMTDVVFESAAEAVGLAQRWLDDSAGESSVSD